MIVSELLARLGWQVDNRGLNEFRNNLNNLANHTNNIVSKIKSQFAGLGTAIASVFTVSGIKNMTKEIASLEDLFLRLKALTKTTDADFQKLKNSVLESAKVTSFTTEEVIRGAISLATGGLNAEQIKNAILPLTQFSEATGKVMPMGDYAELVANVMNAWEMKNEEFFKATDIMTAAVNNATLDIKDFAYSMRYIAGISADMGKVSLEETAALISTVSTISKGTMSGTALAQLVGRLAAPSKGMLEQFQKVGINPFTKEGFLRPLKELIPEISKQMQKSKSRREIADFFRKEFGQPALAEVLYLFSRPQKFLNMVKIIENSQGTTSTTASASISPLTKMFSAIEVSTTQLKSAIIERLEPVILRLGDVIVDLSNSLTTLIKNSSTPTLLGGFGTTIATMLGLILGVNIPNSVENAFFKMSELFFNNFLPKTRNMFRSLFNSGYQSLNPFSKLINFFDEDFIDFLTLSNAPPAVTKLDKIKQALNRLNPFFLLGRERAYAFINALLELEVQSGRVVDSLANFNILPNIGEKLGNIVNTIKKFIPTLGALTAIVLSFFLVFEDWFVFLQGGDSFVGVALGFEEFRDTILLLIGSLEQGLEDLKSLWVGILAELGIYTNGEWKDILLKTFTAIYIGVLFLANAFIPIAKIILSLLYSFIKTVKFFWPYIKSFIEWIAEKLGKLSVSIPKTIENIVNDIIWLRNEVILFWNKLKGFASFIGGGLAGSWQWLKDILSGKEKIGLDTKQLAMAGISAGATKNIVQTNNITVNTSSTQPNDIAKSIKNNIPREFIF
jgi:TP901 family phage tail tape measure protein